MRKTNCIPACPPAPTAERKSVMKEHIIVIHNRTSCCEAALEAMLLAVRGPVPENNKGVTPVVTSMLGDLERISDTVNSIEDKIRELESFI